MRTPGSYALDHANGKSWADIVQEIREEAVSEAQEFPPRVTNDEE